LPRRFVVLLISLTLVIFSYTSVQSQSARQDSVVYKSSVERDFQEALRLFKESHYGEASEGFRHILEMPETTQRTSAAFLMAAKSLYHEGNYRSSAALLRSFLVRFDKSEYLDDVIYTLGLDFYQLEQYTESARSFLTVRETSDDTVLAARAVKMLGVVAKGNLEIPEVRALLQDAHQTGTKALLTLLLAEKVLRTGNTPETRELLRTVLTMQASSSLAAEARDMLERIDRSGVVRIGVIIPLTFKSDQSSVGALGQELLNGMRLAADEYNAEFMPKVNLEVRDSERDAGVAARQVSELSSDDQILAIMGPVFSNEVFAGAPLANKRGIPLITPTATASGIAAIGEYVFQANPDFAMRGRAMALYASQALGAHTFAVLSSSDTINKSVTEAFVAEVKDLGGQLVDVQWYSPGQTDLRDELAQLRRRGMELSEQVVVSFSYKMRPADLKRIASWGVAQQFLDSLVTSNAMATVESLFGEDGARIADSLRIPTQRIKAKYDSLAYPVTSIDAMFVSIAGAEEIGIVTSQLRYFNFQTQLLGTGNWYDPAELEQNRQYASGVIFATDAYWQDIDQQYQQFAKLYRSRYSKDPPVNAMIGYDSMKLLLRTIRQGATHRDEVMSALSSARPFQGVHSKISLDQGRVNACLTLLQFKGRVIKKVGEIDVSRKAIKGTE
jgi:ABC-type branched-subunit amino acid transport system substrate-binding protein/TolA-binding protein